MESLLADVLGLLCSAMMLVAALAAVPRAGAGNGVPRKIRDRARAFQRQHIEPRRYRYSRLVEQVPGVSLRENASFWLLRGRELVAVIDKATGLISAIISLRPRRAYLLAPTRNGLLCYLWNRDQARLDIANRVEGHSARGGKWQGRPYVALSTNLAFSQPFASSAARVGATYRMLSDRLDICLRLEYLRSDSSPWEAGVCQAYDPRQWQRQIFVDVARTTRALRPQEKAIQRYSDVPDDATGEAPDAPLRRARYPYGILERADRLFLWGFLDLNCFAVMTPNRFGGVPSFSIAPTGIAAGDHYSFDFTYKVLPKPRYDLADMCGWYAQNLYSTNPLTAGIVRLPKVVRPRTLAPGNVISGFYPPGEEGQGQKHERTEADARKMNGVHLWYGGWHPWNEDHPTSGRWYAGGGLWQTAEGVKKEIHELRGRGFEVYLYFRQIRHDVAYYGERPPYRNWIHLTEGGFPWNFDFLGKPSHDVSRTPIPPEDRAALGIEAQDYSDVFMDLCNDDCREWLTKEIIAALDYYQPSGVAWDMGWGDILEAPCVRHPQTGLQHAALRIQYDVYQWIRKHHPWMKIIGNEFKGSPSQLYCDAMMFEAGDHLDQLTMQSMKFFRTACTGLYYREAFTDQQWPQAVMRHLSFGITFGGRVEELARPPFGELTALAHFSAKANNTPLVIERAGLVLTPDREQVTGAAWAGGSRLLIAIFNDLNRSTSIEAVLDRRILRSYGYRRAANLRFTVLRSAGTPRADRGFSGSLRGANRLHIIGRLQAKEMLLAEA